MSSKSYRDGIRMNLMLAIMVLLVWLVSEPSARLLLQNQFDAYAMRQPHASTHGRILSRSDARFTVDGVAGWFVTYEYTISVSEDVNRTYQRQQLVFTNTPARNIVVGRSITVWYLLANPQLAWWKPNNQPPTPSLVALCAAIAIYSLFPVISVSIGLATTLQVLRSAPQPPRRQKPITNIPMYRNREQRQMQDRNTRQEEADTRRLLQNFTTSYRDDQTPPL